MPVKHHPMYQAPAGTVFAIAIAPAQWGFVRFYRGRSMAVLAVVGKTPRMPSVDWQAPPVGWVFFSFAPDGDGTQAVALGTVPFAGPGEEWGPPCFDPPDVMENCYRVHQEGRLWKTQNPADVAGMNQCRTLKPAELAEFLRERLKMGELQPV